MTISAYPPNYSSVNGDLIWTTYSANAVDPTKLNYKYIGEVWIGGVKQFSNFVYPNPVTGYGIFNFGSVIREFITASLKAQLGQGEFAIDVVFKVKERYITGGTLTTSATTDDSTRTFFNHYNARFNDFTLLGAYANKPATTRPLTIELFSTTGSYYLPYFATSTSAVTVVINGSTSTITPAVANSMLNVNIAVGATSDYTVVIGGVTYNVSVICETVFKKYVIHFLNQFGGFESMSFHKASKTTNDIERKEWQQLPFRVDSSGVVTVKSGSIMYDQRSTFGVKVMEKLKVSTDLLSDAEYTWLLQLLSSPIVYLEDAGTLYPVVITDNSYDQKQYTIDGLNNLELNLEFGNQYKTQFR